jgi:hypothetical protein
VFAPTSLTPNISGKARTASVSSFSPYGVKDDTLHLAPGPALVRKGGITTFCFDDIVGMLEDTKKLASFTVRSPTIGALGSCVIGVADFSVILVVFIRCQKSKLM